MKLNHLNITVEDVKATRQFLEEYFDLKCIGSAGNLFAALNDEDGFLFNLIEGKDVHYPKTFHIGFPQANKEEVDKMYEKLKIDGFNVWEPTLAHGSYTFYFQAPGEFTVEVYTQTEEKTVSLVHPYFDEK